MELPEDFCLVGVRGAVDYIPPEVMSKITCIAHRLYRNANDGSGENSNEATFKHSAFSGEISTDWNAAERGPVKGFLFLGSGTAEEGAFEIQLLLDFSFFSLSKEEVEGLRLFAEPESEDSKPFSAAQVH